MLMMKLLGCEFIPLPSSSLFSILHLVPFSHGLIDRFSGTGDDEFRP